MSFKEQQMKSKTKNKLVAFVKEAILAAVAAIMGVAGACGMYRRDDPGGLLAHLRKTCNSEIEIRDCAIGRDLVSYSRKVTKE